MESSLVESLPYQAVRPYRKEPAQVPFLRRGWL